MTNKCEKIEYDYEEIVNDNGLILLDTSPESYKLSDAEMAIPDSEFLDDKERLEQIENQISALNDTCASIANMLSFVLAGSPNLDNCTHNSEMSMPLKGADDMHRRQKLTINGITQWRSFDSIQDLVDMVAAAVKAENQPKSDILFGDYMEDWYHRYKERDLNPDTREGYKSIMKVHINPVIGQIPISDITVADVQKVMDGLKSASYAKQTKSIINLVMNAAIADELYHHPNPTKDARIIMPTAVKKREPVDGDDMRIIIDTLPNMKAEQAKLLVMLIMTGCRRGEALGTRWEDIDWATKTIHLQRVVRFRHNRPEVSEKMKSRAANRTVSLWDDFIPYLGERQESGYIINSNGEPLSETQYRRRWNALIKVLQRAGVENRFTAHQLRHSYATVAANSGNIPPKVLQGMLGHANFQTTMNIYADFDGEKIREGSHGLSEEYARFTDKSCR